MRKIIPLSLIALSSLYANTIELTPISVNTTVVIEVAKKAQISADVAAALTSTIPSIDISRRSGIANDILIRGQKRDNISIEVDGTKVHGACPNRMDPPVSHILANQIDTVEVTEGPYDVTTFGVLGGGVKVTTKKPSKDAKYEINFGFGSFNYKKFGATASGGNDFIRMLVTASTESSNQYKDGNGDTIAEQIDNYGVMGTKLQSQYHDMKAYTKNSVMAKAFVTTAENHELRLSLTANRSTDILYGNSKMDALYDDSNIYSIEYNIDNLSDSYKNVNLQYYFSEVDHPMTNHYRVSPTMPGKMDMTSHLKTSMQGVKLKHTFEISNYELLVGLDGSNRTWDGRYYNTLTGMGTKKSIDDSKTNNTALFAKVNKSFGDLEVAVGTRFDSTKITNQTLATNKYTAVNANILTTYKLDKNSEIFLGAGQASRVPDARELYFTNSQSGLVGTPTLNQTTNRELDFGFETSNEAFTLKAKTFYSSLKDYIYITKGVMANAFSNIDATIYGAELSASYFATDDLILDLGASYKKGKKDSVNQTDRDLADMAPLRANLALSYEYANDSMATLEAKFSDKWSDIDSANGEQELAAWSVLNMKVKHAVNKKFDFTFGVDNILDKAYATSNTYADLTLITTGGADDLMLMNEVGRYFYTNLDFKF